eukprot:2253850-Rhodomonas_salina.1
MPVQLVPSCQTSCGTWVNDLPRSLALTESAGLRLLSVQSQTQASVLQYVPVGPGATVQSFAREIPARAGPRLLDRGSESEAWLCQDKQAPTLINGPVLVYSCALEDRKRLQVAGVDFQPAEQRCQAVEAGSDDLQLTATAVGPDDHDPRFQVQLALYVRRGNAPPPELECAAATLSQERRLESGSGHIRG